MRRFYLFAGIWIKMLIMIAAQETVIKEISNNNRKSSKDYKEFAEFELSFFTEQLGFVDDEYNQHRTVWGNFMPKYLQFIAEREAYGTRITKTYYSGNEYTLCFAYLSDPFFKRNFIYLEQPSEKNPYRFELKSVKFHYFSRITELVKVIGCPVSISLGDFRYKESRLYFYEFHYTWGHKIRHYRGYFVFANINMGTKSGHQHLELLMYTSRNKQALPPIDDNPESEEAEYRDSRNRRINNLPDIKLYIEVPPFAKRDLRQLLVITRNFEKLHLFGEEAELFLLSKKYGFFSHKHPNWQKKNLVLILDRMGKGYELNEIRMEMVRLSDTKMTCINYVKNNEILHQRGFSVNEEFPSSEITWTTKSVQFPLTHILPDGRHSKLLKCPVKHREYTSVYILPVIYRASNKSPKVFSFVENEKNPDEVFPLVFSSVDQTKFVIPNLIDLSEPLPDSWLSQ